ncbi:MAG: hypothetical protein Q9188_000217 [Gyalolechia gomerana]
MTDPEPARQETPTPVMVWREHVRLTGFLQNGALAVPGGREIAPIINHLLSLPFTLKIATRDFHPPDHVSFDKSHPPPNNQAFSSSVTIVNPQNSAEATAIPIWPAHCVQGTPGTDLIPEINASRFDRVIDKGRDKRVEMFSPFADAFGNKSSEAASFDLAAFLKEKGIQRVFVVGLAGDFCVRCTAIDAKKAGFEVLVIEEGVRSIEQGEKGWDAVKRELGALGIEVVKTDNDEITTSKSFFSFFRNAELKGKAYRCMTFSHASDGCTTADPSIAEIARRGQRRSASSLALIFANKSKARLSTDVKNETNKDGSGKGQMTAWKGMKISKEYEKKGGDYENEAGTENKPAKGAPEPKSDEQKKDETKDGSDQKQEGKEKPKANSGKKATGKKGDSKSKAAKQEKKTPTEGTRKSSRIGSKRSAPEEEKKTEEKAPAKKAKTAKK